MHVDEAFVTVEVPSPHPLDELPAGEHTARCLDQRCEELKLETREFYRFVVDAHLVAPNVDGEPVESRQLVESGLDEVALASATEHRTHSRDEFSRAERLGDVVIGAQFEADQLVGLVGAGGQDDDVDRRRPPDLAQHVEATDAR